ncbi:hypothetical protein B9Q04_04645 [Candidatus Marsarchaeota G2 archaeon BE_D]|uniref:Metallo-beta-lactamase domain-containing protein n=1 Tax=Candidatus Marsarchaeota G2 archaeon BE_D TaxID=1978158 RepID=A0A2R6CCK5_9ARCH|nr:MAG: hypothetical protein B9Q04_04645 [Candidatus Marsarchaeota G2 archaeon BE_D]
MLRIYPLNAGSVLVDKSILTAHMNYGIKIEVPSIVWLIEGGPELVIVDTSFGSPELMEQWHWPVKRTPDQEIAKLLENRNITPSEVGTVVISHLHWDHCWNLNLFRKSRIVVQKSELEYAQNPLYFHAWAFDSPSTGRKADWHQAKFTEVDGDYELFDGVRLLLTPSHTYGDQSVLVNQKYLITPDLVPLFENWTGNKLIRHIPPPYYDAKAIAESFRRVESLMETSNVKILPSHDFLVLKEQYYQ